MAQRGRPRTRSVEPRRSAVSALVSAFGGDQYLVIPWDGGYCLYDKTVPYNRANAAFLGKFYLSTNGTKYVFNDMYYDDAESLLKAMENWMSQQPFDRAVYDPTFRAHMRVFFVVADYLKELGFKRSDKMGYKDEDIFELKDMYGFVLCEIMLSLKEDTTEGSLSRTINGSIWQEAKFTDFNSAIGACNSLLAAHILPMNSQTATVLDKMTTSRASEVSTHFVDLKTLSHYSGDAKAATIKRLEDELKRLKEQ